MRRVVVIVLDSVGIGAGPDSSLYGDSGSNTLHNTAEAVGGLIMPHLQSLGLGNIGEIKGVPPAQEPRGCYGRMREKSKGKDTTTGHWEMMGTVLDKAFPTFPDGFPLQLIHEFENRIGRKTLGNKAASGTAIIDELGPEHMRTGYPIVYTSADSVFQIAAHENIITVPELYRICAIARQMLAGENAVGRVIARPFTGEPGHFTRTAHRHDYSLKPGRNVLQAILDAGQTVIGVGKIQDIFAGEGITESYHINDNQDGINQIIKVMKTSFTGLLFANLVDFDQLFGHRNDPRGYAKALEEFDVRLPEITERLKPYDMLVITADHGCDPTTVSTDHSREDVPLLVAGSQLRSGVDLGIRETFADLGATIAEYLDVPLENFAGKSFYCQVRC